jgi:glycerol-3-phosphate acyltransferase PlsY
MAAERGSRGRRSTQRGRWTWRRTLLALPVAFGLGCVPTARLVARSRGVRIDEVGDRKPGSANVLRSLGFGAGLTVISTDAAKGYATAAWAKRHGAGPNSVGILAVTPVVANIAVVRGRGAASTLGGAYALDALMATVASGEIVAGTIAKHHAEAVMIGTGAFGPLMRLRRNPAALWGSVLWGLMIYARLRGPRDGEARPLTREALRSRFWLDREP